MHEVTSHANSTATRVLWKVVNNEANVPSAETTSQNITLPYRDYESAPPRAFCFSLEDDRDIHAPTKLPSRTSRGLSTPAGSTATACGNPFRRTRGECIRVVVEHLLRIINAVITYEHSRARLVVSRSLSRLRSMHAGVRLTVMGDRRKVRRPALARPRGG